VDLEQTPAMTGASHNDRSEPSSSITVAIGLPVEESRKTEDELRSMPKFLYRSQTSVKIPPSPGSSQELSREAS